MSNINTVAVSGNLAADPVYKEVGQGSFPIADLRIAVNESRKTEGGEYEERASFFDVTILGNFAKVVDRKLRKGDRVSAVGKLEQQRWETESGDKRSKVVIIARDLDSSSLFLKDEDVKPKSDGSSNGSTTSSAASAPAATDDDIPF